MRGVTIVAVLLITASLAGCATQDDDDAGENLASVEVSWVEEPRDMDAGQSIDFSWELDGPEGEIQHTGVHWADFSVSDPESPADYGNSSGVEEPANVPDEYSASETIDTAGTYYFRAHAIADGEHTWSPEVSIEVSDSDAAEAPVVVTVDDHTEEDSANETMWVNWSVTGAPSEIAHTGFHWSDTSVSDPSSPADYGNSSGVVEPAAVPSSYNASFSEDEAGSFYGRAHAIHQGQHYWSEELTFEVSGGSSPGQGSGSQHTVEMTGFNFEPAELTVQPGDTINWTNVDSVTHTATFEDNESGADSGDVAPGESFNWTVPEDMEPGTHTYRCTYHSANFETGMVGEITVEDA